jgi:putative AlgH/UPF0301 family transcriptional regulator
MEDEEEKWKGLGAGQREWKIGQVEADLHEGQGPPWAVAPGKKEVIRKAYGLMVAWTEVLKNLS